MEPLTDEVFEEPELGNIADRSGIYRSARKKDYDFVPDYNSSVSKNKSEHRSSPYRDPKLLAEEYIDKILSPTEANR